MALALSAAACGADETATTPTLEAEVPTDPASGEESATEADEPESGQSGEADQPEAESSGEDDENPAAGGAEPETEVPVENLFPDIDVVDIADGSTVNLATELGSGDRPTLLWFWAPH